MPQRGAKGQVAPATPVHPQSPGDCESSISHCCPTCRAKEQEEEKGRCFPRGFFLGGDIPQCMAHTCPGGWGTPELQRRVTVVSAQLPRLPAWLQISSFIVVIANASTTVKIKLPCAEIRPRPSPTPQRKGTGERSRAAAFYHRDAEEKGMGNTRRPLGDLGDFFAACRAGHCWSGK